MSHYLKEIEFGTRIPNRCYFVARIGIEINSINDMLVDMLKLHVSWHVMSYFGTRIV